MPYSQNWDTVTAPAIPADWVAPSAIATISTASAASSPNALSLSAAATSGTRYFATLTSPDAAGGDAVASASFQFGNTALARWGLTIRGNAAGMGNGTSPTCYILELITQLTPIPSGATTLTARFSKLVAGVETQLGSQLKTSGHGGTADGGFVVGDWYVVTLTPAGTTLSAQVQHVATGDYLQAGGTFTSGVATCLSVTDSSIAGAGYCGVAAIQSIATSGLLSDDYGLSSLAGLGTAPGPLAWNPARRKPRALWRPAQGGQPAPASAATPYPAGSVMRPVAGPPRPRPRPGRVPTPRLPRGATGPLAWNLSRRKPRAVWRPAMAGTPSAASPPPAATPYPSGTALRAVAATPRPRPRPGRAQVARRLPNASVATFLTPYPSGTAMRPQAPGGSRARVIAASTVGSQRPIPRPTPPPPPPPAGKIPPFRPAADRSRRHRRGSVSATVRWLPPDAATVVPTPAAIDPIRRRREPPPRRGRTSVPSRTLGPTTDSGSFAGTLGAIRPVGCRRPRVPGRVAIPRSPSLAAPYVPGPTMPPWRQSPMRPTARRERPRGAVIPAWLGGVKKITIGPGIFYNVYGSDAAGLPIDYGTALATTAMTTWTTGTLGPGTWRFGVRAFDQYGEEQNLDCSVTIVLDQWGNDITMRPVPPAGLRSFPLSGGRIRVEWTSLFAGPAGKAATSYNVYMTAGSTPDYTAPAAVVPASSGLFGIYGVTLAGGADEQLYRIAVRAVNAFGDDGGLGSVAVAAEATGPPRAVVGLTGS